MSRSKQGRSKKGTYSSARRSIADEYSYNVKNGVLCNIPGLESQRRQRRRLAGAPRGGVRGCGRAGSRERRGGEGLALGLRTRTRSGGDIFWTRVATLGRQCERRGGRNTYRHLFDERVEGCRFRRCVLVVRLTQRRCLVSVSACVRRQGRGVRELSKWPARSTSHSRTPPLGTRGSRAVRCMECPYTQPSWPSPCLLRLWSGRQALSVSPQRGAWGGVYDSWRMWEGGGL